MNKNNLIIEKTDTLVLLGGGRFLLDLTKWAIEANVHCVVITSPRHAVEKFNDKELSSILKQIKISYLVTDNISDKAVKIFLENLGNKFYLSLGAAWIFKERILDEIFDGRLINAHGTRLPVNRGGGGFSWQILMGNKLGFCQLHLIDSGIDTGDIIFTEEFLYPNSCRVPLDFEKVYYSKLFSILTDLISRSLNSHISFLRVKQSEYLSTYWPRLNTDLNAFIDWSWEVINIERFICAFDTPYGGAKTYLNGKKVALKKCCVDSGEGSFHPYQSGIVYRKNLKWIFIAKEEGSLLVEEVLDENGRNIIQDIQLGDRFCTPSNSTDQSKQRVIYTPKGQKLT